MDFLAIDTEAHPFAPGNMTPPIVCATWATADAREGIVTGSDARDRWGRFVAHARQHSLRVVGHNIAHDAACMIGNWGAAEQHAVWDLYNTGLVRDTLLEQRLLDIAEGQWRQRYGLAALAHDHKIADLDKDTCRLGYDAMVTAKLHTTHRALVPPNYDAFDEESARQACYGFALQLTSACGICVDGEQVERLRKEQTARIEAALRIARQHGLVRSNGTRDNAAVAALIQSTHPHADRLPKTDGGKTQATAEIMEECNHPGLSALADFQAAQKLISTYLEPLGEAAAKGVPVHASYETLGADSGRTSSHSPNIQNQPRLMGLRECFVPRPGNVFVFCDFDSQELRTLAQATKAICGKSSLMLEYERNPDFDPHTQFAARLMGITDADALARKKAGDKDVLAWRQRAKAANFGFPGGMGADKFRSYARGYGLTLSEADTKALRDGWFAVRPEMRDYFAHVSSATRMGSAQARQLFSGRLRGGCGYTELANTYFQGLAADASKSALWEVVRRCFDDRLRSPLLGAVPIVFIHDEIGLECPEECCHEVGRELERVMVEAMQELTPDVPARASACAMRRWSKAAKPTYEKGRLIPWQS